MNYLNQNMDKTTMNSIRNCPNKDISYYLVKYISRSNILGLKGYYVVSDNNLRYSWGPTILKLRLLNEPVKHIINSSVSLDYDFINESYRVSLFNSGYDIILESDELITPEYIKNHNPELLL